MKVSSKKIKKSSKGKSLRSFLILLFLLAAIIITVLFLQKQLEIRQHASTNQATITISPASASVGDTLSVSWQLASSSTSTQDPSSCTADSQCAAGNKCFHYATYPGTCRPAGTVCAEAIVNACNPSNTTECVDFPNVCYVPPGWITAQPSRTTACSPRPNITRNTTMDNVNKIVTVTANAGTNQSTATNTLHGITFTRISNATLVVPTNWTLTNPGGANPTYTFPANTTSVSFQERRIACGAVTVEYKWTDDCGEYSDFSGAGTGASGLTCTQGYNLPSVDIIPKVYAQTVLTGAETIQLYRLQQSSGNAVGVDYGRDTAVGAKRYLDCQALPEGSGVNTEPVPPVSPVYEGTCRMAIPSDAVPGSYVAQIYSSDGSTILGTSNVVTVSTASMGVSSSDTTAAFSADPMSCVVGADGKCSATLYWSAPNQTALVIKVRNNPTTSDFTNDTPVTGTGLTDSGNISINWVTTNNPVFDLYAGSTLLKTVIIGGVTKENTLVITKNPCTVGSDGRCSTMVLWAAPNLSNVSVRVRLPSATPDPNETLMGAASTGSSFVDWITEQNVAFDLWSGTTLVNTVTAHGVK